jgi:hypothetical protein
MQLLDWNPTVPSSGNYNRRCLGRDRQGWVIYARIVGYSPSTLPTYSGNFHWYSDGFDGRPFWRHARTHRNAVVPVFDAGEWLLTRGFVLRSRL